MKRVAFAVASLFTVAAPLAQAAYDRNGNYYEPNQYDQQRQYEQQRLNDQRAETARVIESRPVYASGGDRKEECWNARAGHFEERRDTSDSTKNGTIAGAVVGGVVGHQFDNGSTGATLGGALLGGLLGNKIDKDHNSNEQNDLDLSRCRMVSGDRGELQGYDVRYRYRGQEYNTRMKNDPGRALVVGENIKGDGSPFDEQSTYTRPAYSWR